VEYEFYWSIRNTNNKWKGFMCCRAEIARTRRITPLQGSFTAIFLLMVEQVTEKKGL
jgi:hypothetical protein